MSEVNVEIVEDEIKVEVTCGGGGTLRVYEGTVNLVGLAVTQLITTVTTYPYSIMVCDASDNLITDLLQIRLSVSGGFYVLNIYSVDDLVGVKVKIIY